MTTGQSTQIEIGGRILTLETGRIAKQADGAVVVRYGETVVLATVVASKSAVEGQDFFPLSVDYRERAYAGGRIPGGFFKREGRPAEKEILTSRLIDRPLRPLFPKGFRNEIQVIALAISGDQENDPGLLAMVGASAAVSVSGVPFLGPFGAVRIGQVDGRLVVNPTFSEHDRSTLDLVVAATEDSVVMVEAGAKEVPEPVLVEAIALAHAECKRLVRIQRALADMAGKPRWAFEAAPGTDPALESQVRAAAQSRIREAIGIAEKTQRGQALSRVAQEVMAQVDPVDYGLLSKKNGKVVLEPVPAEQWVTHLADMNWPYTMGAAHLYTYPMLREFASERYGMKGKALSGRPFNQFKNYVWSQLGQIPLYEILVREGREAALKTVFSDPGTSARPASSRRSPAAFVSTPGNVSGSFRPSAFRTASSHPRVAVRAKISVATLVQMTASSSRKNVFAAYRTFLIKGVSPSSGGVP